jgi:hypothetical protein
MAALYEVATLRKKLHLKKDAMILKTTLKSASDSGHRAGCFNWRTPESEKSMLKMSELIG